MKNKLLVCVENLTDVEKLKSVGVSTFLFPLKDFCVGHAQTFSLDEIENFNNNYVLVNRILDSESVLRLEEILPMFKNIKGIVFDDAAVFRLVKRLQIDLELIWWQNHFGTNSEIINFWLDLGVTSAFVSNEITKEQIEYITNVSKKELVVQIFGYNHIMYSRRLLLANHSDFFSEEKKMIRYLKEKKADINFIALENEYGTVFLNKNIYNGLSLINMANVKYFYIDASMIDINKIMELIQNIDNSQFDISNLNLETDNGFLDKKTMYKLKEQ